MAENKAVSDAVSSRSPTDKHELSSALVQSGRPRRRLVLCCDGTWNRADAKHITNVEKIARSIQTDPEKSGGSQQLVEYITGVGVGYRVDRILGGWLGCGVFNNVRTAYRFLALNHEVGDEIYIFGFSRGAYTARSVAGMIGYAGLLTRDALVHGYLAEALERYKTRLAQPKDSKFKSLEEFRDACCHPGTTITFLGVFDTVGALGVPTVLHTDHQFHDVTLGSTVQCARQALAIDELRRTFAPCLWSVPNTEPKVVTLTPKPGTRVEVPRVKQVWFEGVHSDVGGGYDDDGLSNTTLRWMTDQAKEAGLVFDTAMLDVYLDSPRPAVRHPSMNPMYRLANAFERIRPRPEVMKGTFSHGRRNLSPTPIRPVPAKGNPPVTVTIPHRIASTAWEDFRTDPTYHPPNLGAFLGTRPQGLKVDEVEVVVRLPEKPPGSAEPAAPERVQALLVATEVPRPAQPAASFPHRQDRHIAYQEFPGASTEDMACGL